MKTALGVTACLLRSVPSWRGVLLLVMLGVSLKLWSDLPWGPSLAWAFGATLGGMIGIEMRLIGMSRLSRLLPAARRRLAIAAGLVMLLAMLPSGLLVVSGAGTALPGGILVLAGFGLGARFGYNGLIWAATITVILAQTPISETFNSLLDHKIAGAIGLVLAIGLALHGWLKVWKRHSGPDSDEDSALRGWIRDRPDRPLGWRLLITYSAFSLVMVAIPSGLTHYSMSTGSESAYSVAASTLALLLMINSVLLAITCSHELLRFRSGMRLLNLWPGFSRDSLHRLARQGMLRAMTALALAPTVAGVLLMHLLTDAGAVELLPAAAVSLCAMAAAAGLGLRLAGSATHSAAVTGSIVLALACLAVLGPLFGLVWHRAPSPTWAAAALAGLGIAAVAQYLAARAWSRLPLSSIDHWPLVRIAREASLG